MTFPEALHALDDAERLLAGGLEDLPAFAPAALSVEAAAILNEAAIRMRDNFPYAHPLYAGQMLKPPHPLARAAYALAMKVNPNNHALDGGRASSAMELECVAQIAAMFGFEQHLGHLSSGGTFANLEALWVAGQIHPGKSIVASTQAHYTHARLSGVLGLPFHAVGVDAANRMDMNALEDLLKAGSVGTVVVTLGTTATGAVDPLDEVLKLRERHEFRVHVDAAYGGYFTLAANLEGAARRAYDSISQADSIVVDPHKHGLQPYGCGCVILTDPAVGRLYKHDSPYTYFTSDALHLGEISLECSRAGASAVALWSTMRLLPLVHGGEFARGLEAGRSAALELHRRVAASSLFVAARETPQLDIVVWAVRGRTPEEQSARAQAVFDEAAKLDLHLALARLPRRLFEEAEGSILCLRSVLMKPEHLAWIDEIWARLERASG